MALVMIDIAGTVLTSEDKELLAHPDVHGLILFSRNFQSVQQLNRLCADSRAAAGKPLLIAVDHEGGPVQRFRQGFSDIPAMANIRHRIDKAQQRTVARQLGWLMAAEVKAAGLDISFAPVLDIDAVSDVIGERAFADNGETVVQLAAEFIAGMHEAGMPATGKHFPGHGSVQADSHIAITEDGRDKESIFTTDLVPFRALANKLDGMMPAHVIYTQLDDQPAGFSRYWLQSVLRQQLGFDGMIFSDDLSMHGATVVGDITARAHAALTAGCDMVLVCNDRAAVRQLLQQPLPETSAASAQRLQRMRGKATHGDLQELQRTDRWQQAQQWLTLIHS
ncbi:beta-N-acetylhexosaminidase [Idiomarina seosinensis]|uniref:beta-N-acetylhexosaminidase n=1 Tax=Idiomarina seosinensis TaxID=281739 RepID=UPI00384D8532